MPNSNTGLFGPALPQSLYSLLPNVEPLTLLVKTSQGGNTTNGGAVADGFAAPVVVNARRRKITQAEVVKAGLLGVDNLIVFSVLDDGTNLSFTPPLPDSRMTDGYGVQWTVKSVAKEIFDTLHACICVQGW